MLKFLFVVFLSITLFANTNFEDVISKVMVYHPGIASSSEAIKAAEEGINSAMWQYFPTPSVSLSGNQKNSAITASLNQPLWTGGKLDANYNQAQSSKSESIFALDEKKYQLIGTILDHAENYTQARYTQKALYDGIKRLEEFSKIIDRKISVGLSSLNDKKLLESRIAQIKSDLISNEFKENISLKQISLLMGEDVSSINFLDDISLEGLSSSELVTRISEFNPTLKKYEQQIKSSSFEVDKQKAAVYPSLSLVAEQTKGDIYGMDPAYKNNAVYFKLESSFGAGLSKFSDIEQSKLKLQKLKYDKMEHETQVINSFWEDYNNMQVSKNKISNYEVNKLLSEDVFESNKRLYMADKKQWLDLVNSSKEVMDIDISFLSAKALYLISKYKVALETGLIDMNNGKYPKREERIIEKQKDINVVISKEKGLVKKKMEESEEIGKIIFQEEKEFNKNNLMRNITFGNNQTKIDIKFIPELNKIVNFLNKNKNYRLELIGRSDKSANVRTSYQYNYNKQLALKRAQIIENWLVENKIDSVRITISSEGVDSPLTNNDVFGNEINRRVEFVFRNEKE